MDQNKKSIVSGLCPKCGSAGRKLFIEADQESITCPHCDYKITRDELERGASPDASPAAKEAAEGNTAVSVNVVQFAQYVETPAAGIAYLENRYETLDMDAFEISGDFRIPGVPEMVEKNKVTNADKPETWELVFKSIAFPFKCKLEGVRKLEEQIAQLYGENDRMSVLDRLDNYNRLIRLLKNSDARIKEIKIAARFYGKYDGDGEKLADMNAQIAQIEEQIAALKSAPTPEDLPAVKQVIADNTAAIAERFAEQGVDAEAEYQRALALYNGKDPADSGLAIFEKLGDYKDCRLYAAKINAVHIMFNGLIETNGRMYYIESKSAEAFNVQQAAAAAAEGAQKAPEPVRKTVSELHRVRGGIEEATPVVQGITKFLSKYDGKIFYIAEDRFLMCFDTKSEKITQLDAGQRGDYAGIVRSGNTVLPLILRSGSKFMIKKAIHRAVMEEKKGCFGKKEPPAVNNKNKANLLLVDMKNNTVKLLDEFENLTYAFEDAVFFTQSRLLQHTEYVNKKQTKTRVVTEEQSYYACLNTATLDTFDVFDRRTEVCAIENNKVVYLKRSPTNLNEDLCVFDMEKKEHTLIERNVYNFFKIIDGKIYYVVGSLYNRIVYSINFDGSCRKEIATNLGSIACEMNGWMYAVKGEGRNRILLKISNDGSQRVLLALNFKSLVKYSADYIYFITNDGSLCVVRNDGMQFSVLTEGVNASADVIVESDRIYVLKKETLGYSAKRDRVIDNASLYLLEGDGSGARKLLYGIEQIYDPGYNDDRIFVKSSQLINFRVSVPNEKRELVSHNESRRVQHFYELNKATGEIKLLFKRGEPTSRITHFNKGCFKKEEDVRSTVEPIYSYDNENYIKKL